MAAGGGKISVAGYLTYLDKEMTIMGILSGFCVAALAASIKLLTSKDATISHDLIQASQLSLLMAHIMVLLAALSFYTQRSLLAWYYGQISLEDSGYETHQRIHDWLEDADGWTTWIGYQRWFWLLTGAVCEAVVASVGAYAYAKNAHHSNALVSGLDAWGGSVIALLVATAIIGQRIILKKWSQTENPYEEFRRALWSPFRKRR